MGSPWYSIVNKDCTPGQGDLIRAVPIIELPGKGVAFAKDFKDQALKTIDIVAYDMIILTQSCDMANEGKVKWVQLAVVYNFEEFFKERSEKDTPGFKNKLRAGEVIRYHLLDTNEVTCFKCGYLVVDFGNIRSIRLSQLFKICLEREERLRLNSPYKERLSQHLGRFYMRVGLPSDIPEFA